MNTNVGRGPFGLVVTGQNCGWSKAFKHASITLVDHHVMSKGFNSMLRAASQHDKCSSSYIYMPWLLVTEVPSNLY